MNQWESFCDIGEFRPEFIFSLPLLSLHHSPCLPRSLDIDQSTFFEKRLLLTPLIFCPPVMTAEAWLLSGKPTSARPPPCCLSLLHSLLVQMGFQRLLHACVRGFFFWKHFLPAPPPLAATVGATPHESVLHDVWKPPFPFLCHYLSDGPPSRSKH